MEKNYIIAGFGGQGVLFAGKVLANAFMLSNKNVTWYPCYGAEMRGGTVNCEIVVSDKDVSSVHKQGVDCLIALNQLSLDRFYSKVNSGGTILYNSSLAKLTQKRKDLKYVEYPISELALELGSSKYTNIISLAVLSEIEPTMSNDVFKKALSLVLSKGKESVVESNFEVFMTTKQRSLLSNFT